MITNCSLHFSIFLYWGNTVKCTNLNVHLMNFDMCIHACNHPPDEDTKGPYSFFAFTCFTHPSTFFPCGNYQSVLCVYGSFLFVCLLCVLDSTHKGSHIALFLCGCSVTKQPCCLRCPLPWILVILHLLLSILFRTAMISLHCCFRNEVITQVHRLSKQKAVFSFLSQWLI